MNADQEPRNPSGTAADPGTSRDRSDARPDGAELSDRLDAIADRHVPVPDWSDVVHRADSPPAIPLRPVVAAGGRRPLGRTAIAVAAALIVVVGAVGVFVTTRDDDGDPLEAGPAGPDDAEVIDTGWYIPSPLPDDWEVTSIETQTTTLVGPGTLAVWAAPDGSASLTYASEPFDGGIPMDGPGIQLTGEIRGHLQEEANFYPGSVAWEHDDLLHMVIGNGLEVDEVKHAARQMAAYPGRTDSPIEGLTLVDRSRRTYENRDVTEVTIGLLTPEGRELTYQLSPPDGMGTATLSLVGTIPVVRDVEGQPLEVLRLTAPPVAPTDVTAYFGEWPGAGVWVSMVNPSYVLGDDVEHPSEEDVVTLLESLRPATADQWRSFLRNSGSEVDDQLLAAERLVDLSDAPGEDRSDPAEIDEAGEVVGAATDPNPDSSIPSSRTVLEPWPEPTLALFDVAPYATVGPQEWGSPFGGEQSVSAGTPLVLAPPHFRFAGEQPFDVHECSYLGTTIGLVPLNSDETMPRPDISGCDPTRLIISVEPNESIAWPLPERFADGLPTREVRTGPSGAYLGGTLRPGEYGTVWAPALRGGAITAMTGGFTITPHPCGGFTTEFVDRFIGKTLDAATAEADRSGLTTRVIVVDGVEQGSTDDHRCDRVNLSIRGERVVEVVDVG